MVTLTLAVQATSHDDIDAWCVKRLLQRGYIVRMRGPWETPAQICRRLRISRSKFCRRWKRYPRPNHGEIQRGEKGRLVMLRSDPILDLFLRHRSPARVLARVRSANPKVKKQLASPVVR
jgi:hypothetical protein